MKEPIEERLQASINHDVINGDSIERTVAGLQMQEAVYEIRKLRHENNELKAEMQRREDYIEPCLV